MRTSKQAKETAVGRARSAWSAQASDARARVWRSVNDQLGTERQSQSRFSRLLAGAGLAAATAAFAIAFFIGGGPGWFTSGGEDPAAARQALETQYAEHFEDIALAIVAEALEEGE